MVNYSEDYKKLLERSAEIYNELTTLYSADKLVKNDWADLSEAETRTYRNGLWEYLANLRPVSSEDASTFIVSTGHYLDTHWADYTELPTNNPVKREKVENSHTELEAIVKRVGLIRNALRST